MTVTLADYRGEAGDPPLVTLDITLPPNVLAVDVRLSDEWSVFEFVMPDLVDAYDPSKTTPGEVSFDIAPVAITDLAELTEFVARQIIAMITVAALHEATEFVKVSGLRLVDPHAANEDDLWQRQLSAISALVDDCIAHR